MSFEAIREWQEKLEHLLKAEATAVDAAAKFKIAKDIDEAYAKIQELENRKEVIVRGAGRERVLELIDVEGLRRLLRLPGDTNGSMEPLLRHRIVNERLDGRFDITKLGALLFARSLEEFDSIARKALRIVVYRGAGRTQGESEHIEPAGYAVGFAAALEKIDLLQPKSEILAEGQTSTLAVAPEVVLRELLINALMHQDLALRGIGPMVEIFDQRIEITNPGPPLMDPQRFLDQPPISRNESLSAMLRRVHLCEERGSGIDKAFVAIEEARLPSPRFEKFDHATRVVLNAFKTFAQMTRPERLQACYHHCCLRFVSGSVMTNATLRRRLGVDKKNYAMVSRLITEAVEKGLIRAVDPEARSRSYVPAWCEHDALKDVTRM